MAWVMYEINARTSEPYSSICYIVCEWSDGSLTRASGVIVGVNDVLTAHHVVYSGRFDRPCVRRRAAAFSALRHPQDFVRLAQSRF